jgi:acetolactate synthase regulatory subunit
MKKERGYKFLILEMKNYITAESMDIKIIIRHPRVMSYL